MVGPKGRGVKSYKQDICFQHLQDGCRKQDCHLQHPSRLSPTQKRCIDFAYSVEKNVACQRCATRGLEACIPTNDILNCPDALQCDKKGREDVNDPCTECRYSAGRKVLNCQLWDGTQADAIWAGIMAVKANHEMVGRTLTRYDVRQYDPAPDDMLCSPWHGPSWSELSARPTTTIPKEARECPRPYLPPIPRFYVGGSTMGNTPAAPAAQTRSDPKLHPPAAPLPAAYPSGPFIEGFGRPVSADTLANHREIVYTYRDGSQFKRRLSVVERNEIIGHASGDLPRLTPSCPVPTTHELPPNNPSKRKWEGTVSGAKREFTWSGTQHTGEQTTAAFPEEIPGLRQTEPRSTVKDSVVTARPTYDDEDVRKDGPYAEDIFEL